MPRSGSRRGSGSQDKPHQVLDAVGCQQLDATGTEPHGHGRSRFRPVAHGVGRVAIGRIGIAPVHARLVAGGPGHAGSDRGKGSLNGPFPLRAKLDWIKKHHVHVGQARTSGTRPCKASQTELRTKPAPIQASGRQSAASAVSRSSIAGCAAMKAETSAAEIIRKPLQS